ncbi:MAG: hypothetical protein LBH41_02155, partial [Rickettsiales bacterium]|nr:hypothetical protein [Rickettsiales bacterium]
MAVKTVAFDPFSTQRPGTGGLRRPTREFIQPHYAQGFIQAAIDQIKDGGGRIDTWVIGSDGRFPGREMLPSIVKILIANGAKKIIAANADFVSTTPAVSNLIIKHRADGGFMLSASHNPGGIDGDFGIKIETSRGGQPGDGFNAPLALRAASNGRYLAEDIGDGEALERVEFA